MRKLIIILTIALLAASCENKDLYYGGPAPVQAVRVVFDWQGQYKPAEGMRLNIFSLNDMPRYGIEDMNSDSTTIKIDIGSKVATLAYSYLGNSVYFRNEGTLASIEAYTNPTSRASYTKTYPDEITYAEPAAYFYVALNPSFDIVESTDTLIIGLKPINVIKTYTFEVRNVQGIQFVSDTRGAINGMGNSIYLSTRALTAVPSTLLFDASADKATNRIIGSFKTFGRIGTALNRFTIEILYPSPTGGIMQKSWDVTDQTSIPGNYHIIIDDSGIVVPDEGGEPDSGFVVDVGDWETETIELN